MVAQESLAGKRILVVEDDYYTVTELASRLEAMAAVVAGAAPGVEEALELIASTPDLDGVILGINLGGEMSFPVADELERLGLPFVFATAYSPEVVPARHADKIILRKPFDEEGLAVGLSAAAHPRAVSVDQATQNKIVRSLPTSIVHKLLPLLHVIRMPRGAVLEVANQTISRVYFPIDCIASLVAVGAAGSRIETGLIGNEGMTGTGIALGDNRTPHELINQIEGDTLVMAAGDFEEALANFPELHLLAGRFARSLGIQVSHTALANGKFAIAPPPAPLA
jgi:CheY-like chemotaxis protein